MIAFLTLIYAAILAVLVKLEIVPNKPATWLSIIGWVILLFGFLFIPMQWGAPSGPLRLMTYTVQIIPNVAGQVTEVPVRPNVPVKKGEVLFKIDPIPYQAAVKSVRAQLKFQKLRLEQFGQLAARQAGTRFQVEETEAKVEQLKAELTDAEWRLAQTTVRAPSDGFVTALALRPGQRVTTLPLQPAMSFVETSRNLIVVQIAQIYHRHLKLGQSAELAVKTLPGRVLSGKVDGLVQVTSQGQTVIGGIVPPPQQVQAEPFFVRIKLEDSKAATALPAGTVGTAAIYTDSVSATHIIRKVMIRMEAYLNYIVPFL
jgi:RND family efflux transporter MFP subunit